jgi:sugar phosphate isomerase/epimerase
LDSFSYRLHLEDVDHPRDTRWFLSKTLELGLSGCSLSPRHLQGWDEDLVRKIGEFCGQNRLYLELTSSATDFAKLSRRLIVASQAGARMLRTFIVDVPADMPREQRSMQMSFTVENLKRLGDVAEGVGVVVGIGNRCNMCTAELGDIICRVGSPLIRASFCNAEVLAKPEDPLDAAMEIAPYVAGITLKDWRVWADGERTAHEGCALGAGQARVANVYRALRQSCPKVPITVQLVTQGASASLEDEDRRAHESVRLIRTLEQEMLVA